jgi:hypothetical protein
MPLSIATLTAMLATCVMLGARPFIPRTSLMVRGGLEAPALVKTRFQPRGVLLWFFVSWL